MLNPNVPAWFEISTADLDRAVRFYEAILDVKLAREQMGGSSMAVFPYGGKPNTSGALIHAEDSEPSVQGCVVYLSVDDLQPVLERAIALGDDDEDTRELLRMAKQRLPGEGNPSANGRNRR